MKPEDLQAYAASRGVDPHSEQFSKLLDRMAKSGKSLFVGNRISGDVKDLFASRKVEATPATVRYRDRIASHTARMRTYRSAHPGVLIKDPDAKGGDMLLGTLDEAWEAVSEENSKHVCSTIHCTLALGGPHRLGVAQVSVFSPFQVKPYLGDVHSLDDLVDAKEEAARKYCELTAQGHYAIEDRAYLQSIAHHVPHVLSNNLETENALLRAIETTWAQKARSVENVGSTPMLLIAHDRAYGVACSLRSLKEATYRDFILTFIRDALDFMRTHRYHVWEPGKQVFIQRDPSFFRKVERPMEDIYKELRS